MNSVKLKTSNNSSFGITPLTNSELIQIEAGNPVRLIYFIYKASESLDNAREAYLDSRSSGASGSWATSSGASGSW